MQKKFTALFLIIALIITAVSSITVSRTAKADTTTQTLSPYTGITYTHSSAFEGLNIYNGIDVSKYNTSVDWERVKADGIDFVFIRIGYRGYGKAGTLCNDISFESHISGALEAGLKVGVYYFTQALDTTEAKEEADYCIEKLKDYEITLPVVLDYEFPNTGNGYTGGRMYDAKLSKAAATKNCTAFCETIQNAGYTPMIYANKNDLTSVINGTSLGKSFKIWLANYNAKPTYTGTYEFWQYTEKGKVDGITGNVDCNFWYTDADIHTNQQEAVSLSNAKFESVPASVYTGENIAPTPKLTLDDTELILNTDYALSYQNNLDVGSASIVATGIGNYKGTVSTTFQIRPQKVTSFKKKSAANAISLSWAQNEQATGYQIYRKAVYDESKYEKVKTFKLNTKTAWNNTKLENDHEYFYKIRAYTKIDGKNYYSDYTSLTAATLPGGKKAVTGKKTKLYSSPELSGKSLVTIPKNAVVTYLGRTYTDGQNHVFHIKYTTEEKSYTGYFPSTIKLTF